MLVYRRCPRLRRLRPRLRSCCSSLPEARFGGMLRFGVRGLRIRAFQRERGSTSGGMSSTQVNRKRIRIRFRLAATSNLYRFLRLSLGKTHLTPLLLILKTRKNIQPARKRDMKLPITGSAPRLSRETLEGNCQ